VELRPSQHTLHVVCGQLVQADSFMWTWRVSVTGGHRPKYSDPDVWYNFLAIAEDMSHIK